MSLPEPYPDLDEFLVAIGTAGLRLAGIQASAGAAGAEVLVATDLRGATEAIASSTAAGGCAS